MTLPVRIMNHVRHLLGSRRVLRSIELDGLHDPGHRVGWIREANVITSEDRHDPNLRYLTLDLNTPHIFVASSTKGHHHLLFGNPISREGELEILEVLARHGVIQQGYYRSNVIRGWSAIRLPWVTKQPTDTSSA